LNKLKFKRKALSSILSVINIEGTLILKYVIDENRLIFI
jgi:hypothetical protein